MRYVLLILCSCMTSILLAQDVIFQKKITLKGQNAEALPVYDAASGTTKIFLIDKDSIRVINIDTVNATGEIAGSRPPSKFGNVLGYSISNGKYNIFFSTSGHSALAVTSFDFATGKVEQRVSELRMKGERFVGAASYKNRFFLINVLKGTSTIRLYSFEDFDKYQVKMYAFEGKKFATPPKSSLDESLANAVVYLDNTVPNSLELATSANKLYTFDDKLVLTFDSFLQYTSVITIDVNTFTGQYDLYTHPKVACDEAIYQRANSYIFDNQLYQFCICSSGMVFSILDLQTKTVVKKYAVGKEQELVFANTPIRQEGSKSPYGSDERELSKTKQFLRKVSHSTAGVAVAQGPNGLQVTLGASQELNTGFGAPTGSFGPGPMNVGPGGMVSIPGNPSYVNGVYNGFSNYVSSYSVYIKCLFEPGTFEHKEGQLSDNAFDVIDRYLDKVDKTPDPSTTPQSAQKLDASSIRAKTVFKQGDFFILGYYDHTTRYYVLRRFKEN
jgi:hypothetical protein